jgi:hypothetical protein
MISSVIKLLGDAELMTATWAAAAQANVTAPTDRRYTFTWPLDGVQPAPRGGTTQGVPVMLDAEPSAAWRALQQPGLAPQERDRRAILAMAGSYRVAFDFLEVVAYPDAARARVPYQSWGTEKVYVDRDEPGFVSLVHILEMHLIGKDGAPTPEPMVTKHWRQDWRYEPATMVEYLGRERWRQRAVGADERRGAWLQTVYQVDESPRYASLGRWQHTPSFSTWLSGDTWRPLPRREWSVRDDYQVLLGTNRHTIGPTGWLQEENNLKAVIDAQRALDPMRPYVAREYGVARYERLRGMPFAAADRYYERTRAFWDQVRETWTTAFERQGTITLRGPVDKLGLFMPLFERAELIEEKGPAASDSGDDKHVIRAALSAMGALPE